MVCSPVAIGTGDAAISVVDFLTVVGDIDPAATEARIRELFEDIEASGEERLAAFGLELLVEGEGVIIDNAVFDSAAQKAGLDFDQKILSVLAPADQPSKYLMFIPALLVLGEE